MHFRYKDCLYVVHFKCRDCPYVVHFCILNVGTVPTLCILNIGTVPTSSPPSWSISMTTTICLFDEVYLNGSHGAGRSISLRAAGALVGCRVDLDRMKVCNKLALLLGSPLIYAFWWIRRGSVRSFWPIAAQNRRIWTWAAPEVPPRSESSKMSLVV